MNIKNLETVIALGSTLMKSESVRKALFGTYADGSPRSYEDAKSGEYLSPKDRAKYAKKKKKRKKKAKDDAKKTLDELVEILNQD